MDDRKAEGKFMRRFERLCSDAVEAQNRLLTEILCRNSQTEYGRTHHFSDLHTTEDYQKTVPVTEYGDYEELIKRQIKGEENLLTSEPAVFYCISAGSTSQPKYIPVTKRDVDIHKMYQMDLVMDTIRETLKDVPEEELFGKIFEIGEFFRTFMPDGTMNGVRSGVLHRWLKSEGAIRYSRFTAPKEVLFPEKMENLLYVKLRFALSCRDLTAIHGTFVHGAVRMFQYLQEYWDSFLTDMETGNVSECFRIDTQWKKYLEKHLAPDPDRADELRAISIHSGNGELVRRIWPKVKYIRLVGGSIFQSYMDEMKKFIGDLPIHFYAYAASESTLGAVCEMNQEDACYVLIPDSCFFEFVPENGDRQTPLTFREVKAGKKYELIITTLSGLYRYAIGDLVEVTGFYGKAPVVRISHRKNQVLNIADEKLNVRQLESVMQKFERLTGCRLEGYCVDTDFDKATPFYLVYLEVSAGKLTDEAEALLDQCFQENCFGYKSAREICEIGMVRIVILPKGSFLAYEYFLADKGYRMEQNKPLRMLRTQEQKDFFKKEAAR